MNPTLYLAPIRGITNKIYRNIFPKHFQGFDIAVAPFIAAKRNDKLKGAYIREFEPGENRGLKTIPQIPKQFKKRLVHINELAIPCGNIDCIP